MSRNPAPPETVEEWIAQARKGDARAFNHLVDTFQSLVLHVAYHHLDDDDDAQEACQEAMISAWRAMPRFDGDAGRFRSWLLAIVINSCRDRQRRERRRPHLSLDALTEGSGGEPALPDPGESAEAYAERADLATLLTVALARLAEDHRTIILLDHAGLDYAEMADVLGIEVGTVKSRLSRARSHLRAILRGDVPLVDGGPR